MLGGVPNSKQLDTKRTNNHRHWCPYCKIFISPTKSAILNHEKGDQHKNNVQHHLNNIHKKNKEEKQEQAKMDREIQQLLAAGEKAYYEKDLAMIKPTSAPTKKAAPATELATDPTTGMAYHPKPSTHAGAGANYQAANYNQQYYNNYNYGNQQDYTAAYTEYYNNYYNYNNATADTATAANNNNYYTGQEGQQAYEGQKTSAEENDDDEEKPEVKAEQPEPEPEPQPAANQTGFGEWTVVTTRIVSDDEEEDDDEENEGDTKKKIKKEGEKAKSRKRKQEESAPPPEPEKDNTDDEDDRPLAPGYQADNYTNQGPVSFTFKKTTAKNRNIRKKAL